VHEWLGQFKQLLRKEIEALPRAMAQDEVIRNKIICLLARELEARGLIAVPAWKPPRSTRGRVDLVAVKPETDPPELAAAFGVEALVELEKVKAMEWVEAELKVVVTFSRNAEKVRASRFFLTEGLVHLDIFGPD